MKLIDTLLTLAKVGLRSRHFSGSDGKMRKPVKDSERAGSLIIMGNGPSLRQTIDENGDWLRANDTMAVNFAANAPEFFDLKPKHYILADPHFFGGAATDPNVARLWENIAKADWPMTIHLPGMVSARPELVPVKLPANITREYYNLTPGEGYDAVCHYLYRHGLAMPRPRNVLIPAIMEGIRAGYKNITLVGADHTWPHSLYVDDNNRVVTVQPHFYKDNPQELDRVADVYAGIKLYQVLESMMIAFRSYHDIRRYADSIGVSIVNATPGSLIDAFPREAMHNS